MNRKIAFVISSHIGSYQITSKLLIDDFKRNNMNLEDIFFYVGGYNENSIEEIDGLKIRKVKHNSIDFTGAISIIEDNITEYTHFFLLHDTIKLGDNFYKLISKYNYDNAKLTSDDVSMNMGLYSYEYLQNKKKEILNFKNTDYSPDSIQKFKKMNVNTEDFIFKDVKDSLNKSPRKNSQPIDYYEKGVPRIIEYYEDIDFYKIKANWFGKPNYELGL